MQSRRGRRDRSVVLGVHRLVTLAVRGGGRAVDVRRERDLAVARQRRAGIEGSHKAQSAQSAAQHLEDLHLAVRSEADAATRLELATRMAQGEPGTVRQLAHEQHLGRGTALARAVQPSGNDARGVEDENVRGGDELEEIAKAPVRHGAARSVQHEEPRRAALCKRLLRDQLRGKVVFEVGGVQVSNMLAWSGLFAGGGNPKCRYAPAVAQRPRGVRARNPCCMRNGS